jgi:hypothetical protein
MTRLFPASQAQRRIDNYLGGSLDLRGCDLTGVTLPQTVGGSLYLSGCDLTGVTLPQTVGGSLDLRGCDDAPVIYTDARGYELRRAVFADGEEVFVAGCRFFRSRAAALAHWGGAEYPDKARGAGFVAAINATQEASE